MIGQPINGYILSVEKSRTGLWYGVAIRKSVHTRRVAWFPAEFRNLHLALAEATEWVTNPASRRRTVSYALVNREKRQRPGIQLDQFGRRVERNGEGA